MAATARPDVLAYPSPTASQFVVFIAAMITAGIFVGSWMHNQTEGDEWQRAVTRCLAADRADRPPPLERAEREGRCRAEAERRRAAYALGGAAGAAALGIVLMLVAPSVVTRRRRLKPLSPGLAPMAAKVQGLAGEAGIARAPALMLGPATQRDAFSYGVPGRYRIAVPPAVAVRWKDARLFDPILRHELAHVRHRDVALAWLARSVWYALAPLLALPIVSAIVSGDTSLLPSYVWRAALLALAVQLVSTGLLRARELDADLRAARAVGGEEAVARVVGMARADAAQPWYRRILARHPSKQERLAVLERPERITGVGFLDGLAPAFLAGFSVPLVLNAMTTLLTGSRHGGAATVVAVCLVAPLLAGSVGLGLAREAVVGRVVGARVRPAAAAIGVTAGLLLGKAVSLAQTGVGFAEGLGSVWWVAAMAILALGGVVLCAGLAELWADAAPAFAGARRSWVSLMVVESLLFAALLWFGFTLETGVQAGWAVTREWLAFAAFPALLVVTVVVAAIATLGVLWGARRDASTPGWMLERGEPQPWPRAGSAGLGRTLATGAVAGATGACGLILVRVLEGPAGSVAERTDRYALLIWVGACAAGAAGVALILRDRARGAGAALLAAPLAALVATAGWLAMNTVLGGNLAPDFVSDVARPPVALGLIALACLAPLALVRVRLRLAPVTAVAAVASAIATGVLAFQLDGLLSSATENGLSAVDRAAQLAEEEGLGSETEYLLVAVPKLAQGRTEVLEAVQRLQQDPTTDAERVRRDVVEPLRALLVYARSVHPEGRAGDVHVACVRSLEAGVAGYDALATALDAAAANDQPRLREASARMTIEFGAEQRYLGEWTDGVARLQG